MFDLQPADRFSAAQLLTAMNDAFSDYPVPLQQDLPGFEAFLRQRGVDLTSAVVATQGDEIAALWLTAIRGQAAYLASSGTRPPFRKQGLARAMAARSFEVLKARGVCRFQLEVLQNNPAAIALYQGLGLQTQRDLNSYSLTAPSSSAETAFEIRFCPLSDISATAPTLWQWRPSWQNDSPALEAAGDNLQCLAAWDGDQLAGYLALYQDRASVAQLAVRPALRRRGLGRALLTAAGRRLQVAELLVINADASDAGFAAFMRACEARSLVQQFEMAMPL